MCFHNKIAFPAATARSTKSAWIRPMRPMPERRFPALGYHHHTWRRRSRLEAELDLLMKHASVML